MSLIELVSTAVYFYFVYSYFSLAGQVKNLSENQRDLYDTMRDLYRYKSDGTIPQELDDRIRDAVDNARKVNPLIDEPKQRG